MLSPCLQHCPLATHLNPFNYSKSSCNWCNQADETIVDSLWPTTIHFRQSAPAPFGGRRRGRGPRHCRRRQTGRLGGLFAGSSSHSQQSRRSHGKAIDDTGGAPHARHPMCSIHCVVSKDHVDIRMMPWFCLKVKANTCVVLGHSELCNLAAPMRSNTFYTSTPVILAT